MPHEITYGNRGLKFDQFTVYKNLLLKLALGTM